MNAKIVIIFHIKKAPNYVGKENINILISFIALINKYLELLIFIFHFISHE